MKMDERVLDQARRELASTPAAAHWQKVGVRKRRGVCVPLFSLRSRRDCGIGDAGDLLSLIDWCVAVGASVIQILPINDMGLDSVPYSALSAFALDPVFVALDRLEAVTRDPELSRKVAETSARLNQAQRIDYGQVRTAKMELLKEVFRRSYGPALKEELEAFRKAHPWLEDYLPYRVIKEEEQYRSWEDWGGDYASNEKVEAFMALHQSQVDFHLYLQWVLYGQFKDVSEYARRKGVLLKGDIPILVSRDSADVWRHPRLFLLDTMAGAPPDMYSADGQVWGFPTYNWDELRHADYRWWRDRLLFAESFFALYRIDHVVGFYRIWTVSHQARTGRHGWFVPGEESTWGRHGTTLLTMMLEASSMLPLAEDLGTIPHVCRASLRELGICGLKVQRWEKRWEEDHSIIPPGEYPPLSVSTVSTHDSETLSGWWEAFPEERDQLWQTLGLDGTPPENLDSATHRRILSWVAAGSSLFVIFMLQELLEPFGLLPPPSSGHRINVPGTVHAENWSWRCPVPLEDLLDNATLVAGIRSLWM